MRQGSTVKSRAFLCSTALFITTLKITLLLPLLQTIADAVNLTILPSEVEKIPGFMFLFPLGAAVLAPCECCMPHIDVYSDIDKITARSKPH